MKKIVLVLFLSIVVINLIGVARGVNYVDYPRLNWTFAFTLGAPDSNSCGDTIAFNTPYSLSYRSNQLFIADIGTQRVSTYDRAGNASNFNLSRQMPAQTFSGIKAYTTPNNTTRVWVALDAEPLPFRLYTPP
eukprot:TRINITY_DN27619_c0_g1_i1.p1 TRINITY_DN27619_c0_g1~~TRINITY_DN27619_c0_g1_i1.p1  ORF type:complete len:143 (-),score=38.51 TRINITY_DN27619_c0_g1_i1:41-439(-)